MAKDSLWIIGGLGLAIIAFLSSRVRSNGSDLISPTGSTEEIIDPTTLSNIELVTAERNSRISAVNQEIGFVKSQISEAQKFLNSTAAKPNISCGTRACPLPKGAVYSNYQGLQIPVGVTFRGSQETIDYLGGNSNLAYNMALVQRESELSEAALSFIGQSESKIDLLESKINELQV